MLPVNVILLVKVYIMNDSVRTLETLEFVGGAQCLDFTNTVNSRIITEHDYLMQYSDLVGWANKVGILSPTHTDQLQQQAKQNTREANAALQRARILRELLYRMLSRS